MTDIAFNKAFIYLTSAYQNVYFTSVTIWFAFSLLIWNNVDDYSTLVAVAPERKSVERMVRVKTSWNTICFSPESKWLRIISDIGLKFWLFGLSTALIMKNTNNDTFQPPKFCHENYQSSMNYFNARQTGKIKLIKEYQWFVLNFTRKKTKYQRMILIRCCDQSQAD